MRLFDEYYKKRNFQEQITNVLKNILDEDTTIVCIGTDRYIIDSVAPFVGTMLKEGDIKNPVFGTIQDPIHAVNLEEKLQYIHSKYYGNNIIGIDASIGDDIGNIIIKDSPIHPGRGVGKVLPNVGNYSIQIVTGTDVSLSLTQSEIRLNDIINMAKTVANAILNTTSISQDEYTILENAI